LDLSESSDSNKSFIRRIRNSFAHSRLSLSGKYLILEDAPPQKDVNFRVKILTYKIGNFMNNILKNWNDFEMALKMNGNEN
jgi:hypothetical protein